MVAGSLPKPPPTTDGTPQPIHEFVPCDVTLMKNVRTCTETLRSRLPNLNYLIITAGYLSLGGREDTEEGIDKRMAVDYYSRWLFIQELMPLLEETLKRASRQKIVTVALRA